MLALGLKASKLVATSFAMDGFDPLDNATIHRASCLSGPSPLAKTDCVFMFVSLPLPPSASLGACTCVVAGLVCLLVCALVGGHS